MSLAVANVIEGEEGVQMLANLPLNWVRAEMDSSLQSHYPDLYTVEEVANW
jgi:hypothetical protein